MWQDMICIYMLTMRHQNRIEQARARRDQRSLHHGFVWRRRRGLGILTSITLRAEACAAGGKPSTRLPPGELVEQLKS